MLNLIALLCGIKFKNKKIMKCYLGIENTDNADDQYRAVRMVQAIFEKQRT